MSTWHYDDTAVPVGNPCIANGREAYALGMYDGALNSDQYPDEPEETVIFMSPEGAKAWLDAATAVLTPYIESGDREARIPDADGWTPIPDDEGGA